MMENLKSVVGDTKISPNCLMPKFNGRKIAAVRSYPVGFKQFDNVVLGKKLSYGEDNVISCGDQAMEVEPVVICEQKMRSTLGVEISGDREDGEQIADECGRTRRKVVDTPTWNFQVDNGACLDLVNEIKTRECDMIKPKRRKVSSLRDFPKDLRSYDVVDKKSQEHCKGKSGNVETDDEFGKRLKVDFVSEGDLVDPMVDAFSCRDEFGKQEPVVTVEIQAVLQSDVDMEVHDEALKNEETVEFECGDDDNNSFSMVKNVSLVKTASEDAENLHLLHEPSSLVYPCRFPKRCKVSALRDFPDALKILKAHNKTSEENLKHRAANKLAGGNETACDSQDNVEHIETQIESQESSAPTEKGLSRNVMTLRTSTSVGHDGTGADKQEPANCGANSTPLSTQSSLEVTNSNKRIGGKEVGIKYVNKTIVENSMATPRCPNMATQRYGSATKTNKDKRKGKDKVLKRKQNEGSTPITVILALMAPTMSTLTRQTKSKASYRK